MGRYITSGGRKNALPKSKAGPPEDRGESSRFFRVGPREDRFGVLILLHTEFTEYIEIYLEMNYKNIMNKGGNTQNLS